MNIWILFFIVMILGAIVQATLNSRFNKYPTKIRRNSIS